nr:hypothetical protein CFP56_31913 [Quercus suber]
MRVSEEMNFQRSGNGLKKHKTSQQSLRTLAILDILFIGIAGLGFRVLNRIFLLFQIISGESIDALW